MLSSREITWTLGVLSLSEPGIVELWEIAVTTCLLRKLMAYLFEIPHEKENIHNKNIVIGIADIVKMELR